jgi:uncharacterized protein
MVLSGVFDRFPDLQIITGHWGEVILFYMDRIDLLAFASKLPRKISEYVRQHVYITPSGLFSHRYLGWAKEVIGADHILMSTDYPFELGRSGAARDFLKRAELSEGERSQIASGTLGAALQWHTALDSHPTVLVECASKERISATSCSISSSRSIPDTAA